MSSLPECNECGSDDWTKFYEDENENSGREERRWYCNSCGKEGRIFGGAGSRVHAGAFR